MKTLKITDEYLAKKAPNGFDLVWTSTVEKESFDRRNNKKTKLFPTWEKHYGSLAKCLCGFVLAYVEDFEDGITLLELKDRAEDAYGVVCDILDTLSEIDRKIAEEWKVVKVSSN